MWVDYPYVVFRAETSLVGHPGPVLVVLGCFGHLGQLLRIWQKVEILHILARIWPFLVYNFKDTAWKSINKVPK